MREILGIVAGIAWTLAMLMIVLVGSWARAVPEVWQRIARRR